MSQLQFKQVPECTRIKGTHIHLVDDVGGERCDKPIVLLQREVNMFEGKEIYKDELENIVGIGPMTLPEPVEPTRIALMPEQTKASEDPKEQPKKTTPTKKSAKPAKASATKQPDLAAEGKAIRGFSKVCWDNRALLPASMRHVLPFKVGDSLQWDVDEDGQSVTVRKAEKSKK